ncbi:MAG: protein kinase, partial [Anaerolineales bacterium]|nr:protein kinase [Anaerolineales bacterium]
MLAKTISDNGDVIKDLEAEAVKLQGFSHPNLTKYLGVYQTPTLAFLLEEWVDGPSLNNVLEKGPVSVGEALTYAKAICHALDALHKQYYLHLNLAPELIHVNQRGEIVVGGIADAHPLGAKAASKLSNYPQTYTSPEQLKSQPLDTAADTYALAVILYELITGTWINGKRAPKSNDAIRKIHLDGSPPTPISLNQEIPDHFSRMILWALRKNPGDRLKTTTELLSALALAAHVAVDEIPLQATPTTAPITSSILGKWQFLPPPKLKLLSADTPPLEDRLASLTVSKKKRTRIGIAPILLFILSAVLFSFFWFVRPAEISITTPQQFTPFASDYTPPPTFTPLPKPTDPHGGRIAFTCTRGDFNQLCMINRDGSGLSQLTDMQASNYYPAFTPDGGSLLFSSNRNGSFDLYHLFFSEKQLFQITKNVGNVVSPDYSPDG